MDRRRFLGLAAAFTAAPALLSGAEPIRLGLTPVFLDNEAEVITRLRDAVGQGTGRPIDLIQRRTYQEVTGLLLEGGVDAAWLCGFPFLQHEAALALLGVPVWRGAPLYRSYLIVAAEENATDLAGLEGGTHAFSDPDSNSGWLVTASDLARMGRKPETFFQRALFTYGHRNVVRAVAGGLTRSGSVDGYVWEALAQVEPELSARTKVIARSEQLGFPPFVARRERIGDETMLALQTALLSLSATPPGRAALNLLQLDGIIPGDLTLFDGIRQRMRDVTG
ncbi:phosphonate ABC transporter substrate-binding protein [Gemmobacter aquaticus]|jgi:phosphonate transport system substrate-binding protein|uniref:Phosphonate ABC transporter substrate-binding protein n=1 Tax=Gemmobacter aquaticus TaxID=490185 RepID=A0A917YN43_9RHOB|nr:PhnD/SsuA/transferrin family substrate-binding protein [Gemmobacter aquaticus]GGO38680.1 phosphonate ABC transporter substrate-binding protein [Gemmobacter aquaticus]